jgi:dihydroorotase
MKTLIKNGYILDPATGTEGIFDLLIDNDIITQVQENINTSADTIIDAKGMYVMPGFIDLHVHLREPGFEYKETIRTGSLAAAKGGFTSICPMPNTNPVIDNKYMIEYLLLKARNEAVVNIIPIGAVTKDQAGLKMADIPGMVQAGAKAISEDGKSVMDTALYREGMKLAKEVGIPVMAHCEDKSLVGKGVINEGIKSREFELEGITNAVEDVIVARDILMSKETGVKLHLCHCSTKDSVALVKLGKEQEVAVTAEVCPHHFTMSDEEILKDTGNYKMNPPLRSKEDVLALKEGLRDGIMDVIATDHAPHGEKEKANSIANAPFGIVGLETAFSLTITELVEQGYLTPMEMVEKLSYNPAKIINIDRGSLAVGKIADIVVANPTIAYQIDVNTFVSKGKNSPFHGKSVKGRVEKTFVAGELVYDLERTNYMEEKND